MSTVKFPMAALRTICINAHWKRGSRFLSVNRTEWHYAVRFWPRKAG